jgi:HD domain-containing protein
LSHVAKLVRSSHERWDGTGYPDRLAGEEIPIGARIVTACDALQPWSQTARTVRPLVCSPLSRSSSAVRAASSIPPSSQP